MANIKKEIESLRAKIARLEKEQKRAEQQEKALNIVRDQIDKLLKENGLSLEVYIRSNYAQVSRAVAKIEREKGKQTTTPSDASVSKKKPGAKKRVSRRKKPHLAVKIPAGKYGNLPSAPDQVFEVKEKGPRPKALKSYAEEVGLEAFFGQCRLEA